MKYVKVIYKSGYYGCDDMYILTFPDNITETEIEKECERLLEECAENYFYVAFGWDGDYSEEEYEEYLASYDYSWEYVNYDELTEEEKEEFNLT